MTGHIDKATVMDLAGISEEQWQACTLSPDQSDLGSVLGPANVEGPSVAELIAGGKSKRQRVLWLIARKCPADEMVAMPINLAWAVEKRLCSFLYGKAVDNQGQTKSLSTLIFSKRSGKEATAEAVKKHTVLRADGTRALKDEAPNRTKKDQ